MPGCLSSSSQAALRSPVQTAAPRRAMPGDHALFSEKKRLSGS
eukprot:CAMPEP_0168715542 /NCGR_PEP_ID=MMETSP0503-20121227/45251_1 /TAXON_ID=89963 /ORGANISM="Heterocapsa rotundata, Strain SCCAP K-0483" /LENGTH=42 /DNA_ID= /DNA_START= /DNA_END= /DNA_ORIENTATION=